MNSGIRDVGNSASACEDVVEQITPYDIEKNCIAHETFVVNIIASWCPDCTVKQIVNLQMFSDLLAKTNIKLYQCTVQEQQGVFISDGHEDFTRQCGGHGFPRTVLIKNGQIVDSDNVEVLSLNDLTNLANTFIDKV